MIDGGTWFAHCGRFPEESGSLRLDAVASADTWDWLPTSHDQLDPIYGNALVSEADKLGLGEARRDAEAQMVRRVLALMRSLPKSIPALVDGPHDFTPAAKRGAEFAVRMAARELILGRAGFWCRVVRLFAAGYWPCGLTAQGQQIIVL